MAQENKLIRLVVAEGENKGEEVAQYYIEEIASFAYIRDLKINWAKNISKNVLVYYILKSSKCNDTIVIEETTDDFLEFDKNENFLELHNDLGVRVLSHNELIYEMMWSTEGTKYPKDAKEYESKMGNFKRLNKLVIDGYQFMQTKKNTNRFVFDTKLIVAED